jgi:hypothetical protein
MPGQWPDCPDSQRKKVNEINLAINDMENPCELAQQLGVPINKLWAREVADGMGHMANDIYLPLNRQVVQLISAARPKSRTARKTARPKSRKRRSSK